MIEIARVSRGKNNMETARAFSKCDAFKNYRIGEIIATMRSYEKAGWLVFTDTDAIMYHDYNA